MARGVRQGFPASGILCAMAFDPIFRWLQEAVIPRNPDGLDFLQPAQCAYADDLAVAASSFRGLMTALAPAFHSVDHIAGLNLKVFLRSLQHGIVVMGFIDAFVYAHHQHRRSIENSGNFGDLIEIENPLHDDYHFCLRSRVPCDMPHKTHAYCPASELPLAEAQSQMSASS